MASALKFPVAPRKGLAVAGRKIKSVMLGPSELDSHSLLLERPAVGVTETILH